MKSLQIASVGDYLTILQQPQDMKGLQLGYLRRLNLTNDDIRILIRWLLEHKNKIATEVMMEMLQEDIERSEKS